MKNRNLMGVGFLALFVVSIVGAAPTCASLVTSGAVDVAVGGLLANSISCTAGSFLYSNFQYSVAGGMGTPIIDLAMNGVTLSNGGLDAALNFNPNLGLSGIFDLHFTYTVTGFTIGASLTNAGTNALIQENNCTGTETLSGSCTGTTIWSSTDTGGQFTNCLGNTGSGTGVNAICAYGTGFPAISVWKDIMIGTGGALTSFIEDNHEPAVPEPVTMSLMGMGLLGIGLLGRRLRK